MLANLPFEDVLGHPLARQQAAHPLRRELAILLKGGEVHDVLVDDFVRDHDVLLGGQLGEESLIDQLFEDVEAELGVVEHRRVEALAQHRAHPLLLLAQRVVELGPRDLVAADLGDRVVRRVRLANVRIDAEKSERQRDDRKDDLRHALVLAYEIEHVRNPETVTR